MGCVVIGLWTLAVLSFAQTPLPEAAQDALAKGQQAASEALATYDVQYLDRPLWKEAIRYGEAARSAAPDRLEPYRFLGQVYTIVKWYSRAWDAWKTYVELGGPVTVQTGRYIAEASAWLGDNSFDNQDFGAALTYYDALLSVEPSSAEAAERLALSYLALEQPNEAEGFLEGLVRSDPDNERYQALFEEAREQLTYGVGASRAYREGVELAAAGDAAAALDAFERASQANPDFVAALKSAARTSQDLGRPETALEYWQRVVALEPQNGEALQAVTLTRNQSRWGVRAFAAYQAGVDLYTQGRTEAARQSFRSAVNENSRFGDAWAWLGRIALEAENLSDAVSFYERARTLSPNDSSYANAFQRASQQLAAQVAQADEEAARAAAAVQAAQAAQQAAQEAAQEAADAAQTTEARAATPPPPPAAPEPVTAPVPDTAPAPTEASAPRAARAVQVGLLDVAYTHKSEQGGSGAYSFFGAPDTLARSLTAPVDYAGGTVYQRLEVLSKPSDTPVQYQLCLVPKDISTSPACSNAQLSFSEPGVYETSQPLSSFLNYARVNWANGIDDVMLVVKDGEGRPIDNAYFTQSGDSLELNNYFPMSVRFEAVIVPPGGRFQGW